MRSQLVSFFQVQHALILLLLMLLLLLLLPPAARPARQVPDWRRHDQRDRRRREPH